MAWELLSIGLVVVLSSRDEGVAVGGCGCRRMGTVDVIGER